MAGRKKSKKRKITNITLDGLKEAPMRKKLWIGGGILATLVGIYGITRYMIKSPVVIAPTKSVVKPKTKKTPIVTNQRPEKKLINNEFPLSIGSNGPRVVKVQDALDKLGLKINRSGTFDLTTIEKLNTVGFPSQLDEGNYLALLTKADISPLHIVLDPKIVAEELRMAANGANLVSTIQALRKIKDTQGYEAVKKEFIKNKIWSATELVPRYVTVSSIVTALLEVVFKNDAKAKSQLEIEFKRIGLKKNEVSGTWSLTGLMDGRAMVYTITPTMIINLQNQGIKVPKGKKLGLMQSVKNNMVFFKDMEGKTFAVPYNTIRYEQLM